MITTEATVTNLGERTVTVQAPVRVRLKTDGETLQEELDFEFAVWDPGRDFIESLSIGQRLTIEVETR